MISPLTITNPFSKGDRVTLPAGTVIRAIGRDHYVLSRKQTVTVFSAWDGNVSVEGGERGRVRFPIISWPGAGGYWRDAQVTPEVCGANAIEVPALPAVVDGKIGGWPMDAEPSYDDGYTDRWALKKVR